MNSGAQEIVEALREAGVDTVFGIPSVHNISLYEALRKELSIRHILGREETSATHMADGYARAGNRLGVMIASTGPGTCYCIPAVQEAWGSCSPLLIITTNVQASKIGKEQGVLHELENQDTLFHTITKATINVRPGDNIKSLTREAIDIALSGRPGPVYLEVPTDLLNKPVSIGNPGKTEKTDERESFSGLEEAMTLLRNAKQPILIVGTEAVRAGISTDIMKLAESLSSPVITPTNGKGIIAEDHPLALGNAARRIVVREIVPSCDVALAIGTRLREVDARRRGLVLPRLIHVDWDERWVNKNFPAEATLIGDIPTIVKALLDRLGPGSSSSRRLMWIEEMHKRMEQERIEIQESYLEMHYLDVIRGVLPREGVLMIDNTQLGYWAEYFYPSYVPSGIIAARGSSIIGFAFAAAIGAKIACPDKPVLALIGDGGFLYSTQELATCIRHGIGFPVIVVNDNAYGIISYIQRTSYQKEYESRLANPDFVALARAYGADAIRVDSPSSLGDALEKAIVSQELWVIELAVNSMEPPFGL